MRGSDSGLYPSAICSGSPSKGQKRASPLKCCWHVGHRRTASIVARNASAVFGDPARPCGWVTVSGGGGLGAAVGAELRDAELGAARRAEAPRGERAAAFLAELAGRH